MSEFPKEKKPSRNRRVHMANERTFLSWVRTSLGIMAFGFIIEKFSLFVRQMSVLLGKEVNLASREYASFFGVILIALGAIMVILAFIRYKKVEKEIEEDTYKPSILLDLLLTILIITIGIFFIIYLLHSI
ncbi:MAG: YidH family protein [Caldimicrobium sp.]